MKLQTLAQRSAKKLSEIAGELAIKEAKILISHQLNISKTEMIMNPDLSISIEKQQEIENLIYRRQRGEPVAKIIGIKEFWSLPFKVTANTLDPRPDTEVLVESILEHCNDTSRPYTILDLGTGTGCLILSLLSELKEAKGVAVDCSTEALEVANENAKSLQLSDQVVFLLSDWGEKIQGKFDIIVSNPPYISESEFEELDISVLEYDPKQALVSGSSGVEVYEIISKTIQKHLADDGIFAIEIGINQEHSVLNILKENKFIILAIRKDLSGIPRCIIGRMAKS